MSPEQFTYWLKGYFEISENRENHLSPNQVQIIRDHLDLVFNKVTPARGISTKGHKPLDPAIFGSCENIKYC
jgi:hypothetical protein